MTVKAYHYGRRLLVFVLAALVLLTAQVDTGKAEIAQSPLIDAAFELLEEGNPFTARYEKLTGAEIKPLFKWGVPYYFGGTTGGSRTGWFFCAYPDYHVHKCTSGSDHFKVGKVYFYGLDCSGFARHVYREGAGMQTLPGLSDIMLKHEMWRYHVYDHREGHRPPPYDQLKDTLQVGDLLVVKHSESKYRHIMMYIGTLKDYGYTAEEEPDLAKWLDYPLVIHCGLSPFYGKRFQKLIDEYPEKYGRCSTTDGGVAISIVGPAAEDAPKHKHVQKTDYSWFAMKDTGYQLTVIDMSDVYYFCWYRPQ